MGGRRARLRCRRCTTPSCVCLSVLLLVPLYLCVVFLRGPPPDFFRASSPLRSRDDFRRADELTVPLLQELLQEHPHMHCLGAPAARIYTQVIVIRRPESHGWQVLYNPRLQPHGQTITRQVKEESSMCPLDPDTQMIKSVLRTRQETITVITNASHMPGDTRRTTLEKYDAVCVQHFLDIFSGQWPCAPRETDPDNSDTHLHYPRQLKRNQRLSGHGGIRVQGSE